MRPDLSALLGAQGQVLGQVVHWQRYAVVPLHVLDPEAMTTLTLLAADGTPVRVAGASVLAIDAAADQVLLRLPAGSRAADPGPAPPWAAAATASALNPASAAPGAASAGAAVLVHAVFPAYGPGGGLRTSQAAVRQVVAVRRHQYRAASGACILTQDVLALFLSAPFAPGWSGSPVCRADSGAVIGFIHGNASANGANGVCLLAADNSPVRRLACTLPH